MWDLYLEGTAWGKKLCRCLRLQGLRLLFRVSVAQEIAEKESVREAWSHLCLSLFSSPPWTSSGQRGCGAVS